MSNTTTNYRVTQKTVTVLKNVVLDGVKTLKAEKVTTTFEIKREIHPRTKQPFRVVSKNQLSESVETLTFDLVEVTPKELAIYRKKGIPSFVLKVDANLYYGIIPAGLSFVGCDILGPHRCAAIGQECNRLSPASDEEGGCAKVRNHAKYIERYPWITSGYETFNTKHDFFVVAKCLHYEKCPPHKNFFDAEINDAELELARFVWPED